MAELPNSLQIERQCLATLVQNQEIIADFLPIIRDSSFYSDTNKAVWSCVKALYKKDGSVDKIILLDRVRNLGIKTKSGLKVEDYIDSLYAMSGVNKVSAEKYIEELVKYDVARRICSQSLELNTWVKQNLTLGISDLISGAEKIVGECISSHIADEYTPKDLYACAEEYIEVLGNSPKDDDVVLPFPRWNAMYGGLLKGDLVVFAMPPKAGKTTLVNAVARHAIQTNPKVKALILDTELETERIIRRMVAAETGINEAILRKGKWRQNQEMVKKVRAVWPKWRDYFGKLDHLYVANKTIDEIISIVRRWKATKVKDDETPLIIYDYLKITGESITDSNKEYQVIGQKCDTLKHLLSEVGACGIAPIQTNALGDVAMAQRIKWFASNVYCIAPKTPDEILEHGSVFGTHKCIAMVTRNQGEEAGGFKDYIKTRDSDGNVVYKQNFINLDFNNFEVTEKGTLEDIVNKGAMPKRPQRNDEEESVF